MARIGTRPLRVGCVAAVLLGSILLLTGFTSHSTKVKTMIIAVPEIPASIDPQLYQGNVSNNTYPTMAGPLVRFRPAPVDATTLQAPSAVEGFVAESWKREASGSYVVTLRSDAKSEYGNTITPEDVKWTLLRVQALDFIGRYLMSLGNIDPKNPVTAIDAHSFRINVLAPSTLTLGVLTWSALAPVDSVEALKHVTTTDPWGRAWLTTHSAWFGPYKMTGFKPSKTLFLTTNPGFWKKPDISKVVMQAVPDPSTRLQAALAGQVDFTGELLPSQFKGAADNKNVQAISLVSATMDNLMTSQLFKPFTDVRVRQAMTLAIDRDALVKSVYAGLAKPALSPLSSAVATATKPPVVTRDLAKAKSLMADAGFASGFDLTLTSCTCRLTGYGQQVAELLQAQLAQIGIRVKIDIVSASPEFQAGLTGKKYAAFLVDMTPAVVDPVYFYSTWVISNGLLSYYHSFKNPKFDAAIERAHYAPAGKAFNLFIANAGKMAAADVPFIPLAEGRVNIIASKKLSGFRVYPHVGRLAIYVDTLTMS